MSTQCHQQSNMKRCAGNGTKPLLIKTLILITRKALTTIQLLSTPRKNNRDALKLKSIEGKRSIIHSNNMQMALTSGLICEDLSLLCGFLFLYAWLSIFTVCGLCFLPCLVVYSENSDKSNLPRLSCANTYSHKISKWWALCLVLLWDILLLFCWCMDL